MLRPWRVIPLSGQPLKRDVREQRSVHLASALFVLLIIINVIFAPYGALNIWRVSILVIYGALAYLLSRQSRIGAFAGVVVALLGVLLLGAGLILAWPMLLPRLARPSTALDTAASAFLPLVLNLIIAIALFRALLSNQRLERP